MSPAKIYYFSDVLCVWAYAAHIRLEEICKQFGGQVEIDARFCSVFPDARGKIKTGWKDRGGFEGFNAHLMEVAERFPHVALNDRIWIDVKPRSSASAHLFLKAVQAIEADDKAQNAPACDYLDTLQNRASWALRKAFFEQARDISDWQVHAEVCGDVGIDYARIEEKIRSSEAIAALVFDYQLAEQLGAKGSPTFIMNEGRQKLFGNVGYRLIEANIQELLRAPGREEASWC
ncbi:MAG: DsbA family oxidoreductase [Hyphomicrobiales bacterium]